MEVTVAEDLVSASLCESCQGVRTRVGFVVNPDIPAKYFLLPGCGKIQFQ